MLQVSIFAVCLGVTSVFGWYHSLVYSFSRKPEKSQGVVGCECYDTAVECIFVVEVLVLWPASIGCAGCHAADTNLCHSSSMVLQPLYF